MDKIDNKTPPNVPTLRFKEFADFWQQRTFNETFDILTNNTLSRAELNYEDGEYKNIHYGDVLIKFSAFTDVSSADVPYINDDSVPTKLCSTLLQNGDIVLADTAEDYTVGKATEVENIFENKVVSGLHTIPCRPKMRFSPRYLGYYVNSPKYHNQLIPFIQGVKVSSISKSLIKNTFISYPSLSEQSKIASFLSCLDEKIATQNKIIEDLKILKKELCNKVFGGGIFVRLGDHISEITTRNKTNTCNDVLSVSNKMGFIKQSEQFEDRTVASEDKRNYKVVTIASGHPIRLGEISTIYQPQTITQAELSDNGAYPVFGANGIIGYYHQFNHEKAQIIITCRGSTCGTVNMSAPNSWITGNSMVINVDGYESIVDKQYLFYYLKTISFKSMISGSGQPQIVRKPLVNLLISLPELNTQVKYRSIIDTINKKLVKEKDMLCRLFDLKAYLLSNLFI